jgi:CrcB protein
MPQLLAIALGGSAGALTRFWVANLIYGFLGRGFPLGTLFINVSGSFLMGFLTELMLQRFAMAGELRAAILVGFLGAYTTFSTFSLETLYLFEAGSLLKAFLNIFLSALLCVAACWFGLIWGRTLFSDTIYPELMPSPTVLKVFSIFLVTFFTAILAEYVLKGLSLSAEWRATLFIVLLSLSTMTASLIFAYTQVDQRLEFHTLLSVFVINALLGVTTVWLGTLLGNWLWQLKLSQ